MNILLTGGAGFLGSHVADALSNEGYSVTIFDLNKPKFLREDQNYIEGNLLDRELLEKAVSQADFVYHFGALADIDDCEHDPYKTMQINILGTVNVLESMKLHNVKKIIFASSIYVYSKEGSFYRVSKHACEEMLEVYKRQYNLDFVILRFGTLYGLRSDMHNSVYRYLKSALENKSIEFKGSGEEVREYINVLDASKVCVKVLDEIYSGQAFIITGHHRMKVMDLLETIKEILGGEITLFHNKSENNSHYNQSPYTYIPKVGQKIVSNTYCDLGQSLIEILSSIDSEKEISFKV